MEDGDHGVHIVLARDGEQNPVGVDIKLELENAIIHHHPTGVNTAEVTGGQVNLALTLIVQNIKVNTFINHKSIFLILLDKFLYKKEVNRNLLKF